MQRFVHWWSQLTHCILAIRSLVLAERDSLLWHCWAPRWNLILKQIILITQFFCWHNHRRHDFETSWFGCFQLSDNCSWRRWFLVHSKDKSQRPKLFFFLLHSRWPNVTSRAPMEFKWRASGRQKLAVGLVKFHKGEKGRLTDVQSYTSYKYCFKLGVFITKMIYKQKFQGQWISKWRFKFVRKIRRGEKKNLLNVAWGNMPGHIQSSTQNKLNMITTMSLQNNNSRFNLFRIASCDSCVLPWRTTKKIFRVSQQRTENSIFRVNFRIGFYVITTMILQISNSRFNLFRIESFESWVCFLGEPQKKNLLTVAARNREEHFQSYLSNWLQCYHVNGPAKH